MNLSHVQLNLTFKVNQAIVLELEKYDFDLYKIIFNGKSGPNFARFWMKKEKKTNKQTNKQTNNQIFQQLAKNIQWSPFFLKKNFHIWYGAKFG
jgi:hypothetical protein